MTITPVDDKLDLFYVEDVFSDFLLEKFKEVDHTNAVWQKEENQTDWPRRLITDEYELVYLAMDHHIKEQLQQIQEITKTQILSCDTAFWLDEPGFFTYPHLDNKNIFMSMQVYLSEHPGIDMSTEFYNVDDKNKEKFDTLAHPDITEAKIYYSTDNCVRFKPEYKVNNGYLIVNNPTLYHGMLTPVPEDSYRLSSYTRFYKKT